MAETKAKAPAATKVSGVDPKPKAVKVAGNDALIFKASKPLKPGQFKTLGTLLRNEQEESGVKIVLEPYSAELKG
jgi:hypothetical protein